MAKFTEIPQIVGVKEWSNDIVAFERNLRAIRSMGKPVAVLSSFTMSLFSSFVLGVDGTISGMAAWLPICRPSFLHACSRLIWKLLDKLTTILIRWPESSAPPSLSICTTG